MSARQPEGQKVNDFRLSLRRVQHGVRVELSRLDDVRGTIIATTERAPSWVTLTDNLSKFQEPSGSFEEILLPIGIELGRIAFPPEVLAEVLPNANRRTTRIWLELGPLLSHLPWEASYIEGASKLAEGFINLHPGVHLIRGRGPTRPAATPRTGNTRVLIAWANPDSERFPELKGLSREVQSVKRALESPECHRFEVKELGYATPSSLVRCLQEWQPDVFHFVGHGDRSPTGYVLALE